MKKFRFTDESINTHGFWIKNDGIDFSDFEKNPICLWNHIQSWRGTKDEVLPIGFWEDLNLKDMTATPNLYIQDQFVADISGRIEHGTIRATSIGIIPIEWSDIPALLKPGQTRSTVTKSKLREISIVDIPANKNAVALYDHDGKLINLGDKGENCPIPLLITKSQPTMDYSQIAITLGLKADVSLAEINAEILRLRQENTRLTNEALSLKNAETIRRKAESDQLIDAAIESGRLQASQKEAFAKLFEADPDNAKSVLTNLPKVVNLSDYPDPGQKGAGQPVITYNGKTFKELERENPTMLSDLKKQDPTTFKTLYRASYGVEWKD